MSFTRTVTTDGETVTIGTIWRTNANDTFDEDEEENPLYTTATNLDNTVSGTETVVGVEDVGPDPDADRIAENLETLEIRPNPYGESDSEAGVMNLEPPVTTATSSAQNTPLRPPVLTMYSGHEPHGRCYVDHIHDDSCGGNPDDPPRYSVAPVPQLPPSMQPQMPTIPWSRPGESGRFAD